MAVLIVLVSVLGLLLVGAAVYDWRARRRGLSVRSGRELDHESMHSRIDLNVPPFEPSREAGQQDWATYRRRDRKR
jgi:hypothetical protein